MKVIEGSFKICSREITLIYSRRGAAIIAHEVTWKTKLFVAFPWVVTSTGPGGFIIFVFILWRCTRFSLKNHWREIAEKWSKGDHPFLQAAHRLDPIFTPTKYYQNISKGIKSSALLIRPREIAKKWSKGEHIFFTCDTPSSPDIPTKYYQNISKVIKVMDWTRLPLQNHFKGDNWKAKQGRASILTWYICLPNLIKISQREWTKSFKG